MSDRSLNYERASNSLRIGLERMERERERDRDRDRERESRDPRERDREGLPASSGSMSTSTLPASSRHYHQQQRSACTAAATGTGSEQSISQPSLPSKWSTGVSKKEAFLDHGTGSVKLRKHDSINERHRKSTIETTDAGPGFLRELRFSGEELGAQILAGSETLTIKRHYQSALRKQEALKEEYESLHKRYADLMGSHSASVSKLELTQEELARIRKNYEESVQERNAAIRERNGLQQQCTAAIRQWDKALRECNEAKEQLAKVQQQRDEAMKEINQAMAVRIKATKDLARLTEERNAAVQEYTLIMSERDSVHKEIEKLQEELSQTQKKVKTLEEGKKMGLEEMESLKREVTAALIDRDRVLKKCNDLREKYGDYVTGVTEGTSSPTSPVRSAAGGTHNIWGSSSSGVSSSWALMMSKSTNSSDLLKHNHLSTSNSSSVSTLSHQQLKISSSRLENLDQANVEIEALRRQLERFQHELLEAQQEIEVCKRRRDWAFTERDKIVLERESIKALCASLRRERDNAVSQLVEALRDSVDVKRQRSEASKEAKEGMEAHLEKEMETRSKPKSNHPLPLPPLPPPPAPILLKDSVDAKRLRSEASEEAPEALVEKAQPEKESMHLKPIQPVSGPVGGPAPTLLDKCYNRIFGDRRNQNKQKGQQQPIASYYDENETLAELDKVLDNYSNKNYGTVKPIKSKSKKEKEKNGGTWPKYRGCNTAPLMQTYGEVNAVTTLHPRKRKERKSLAIFSSINKSEKAVAPISVSSGCSPGAQQQGQTNSKEVRITPSSFLTFEPASQAALMDYHQHSSRNVTSSSGSQSSGKSNKASSTGPSISSPSYSSSTSQSESPGKSKPSDLHIYRPSSAVVDSLDYSVVSAQSRDKNVLEYYKNRTGKSARPHSVHDVLSDVGEPLSPTTLALAADHHMYDAFHGSPQSGAPVPPLRTAGGSLGFYTVSHGPQKRILTHHVHPHHSATLSVSSVPSSSPCSSGLAPQPPVRYSSASPHTVLSPYMSRSGDSLLSGAEAAHVHDLTSHTRSVSIYQPNLRTFAPLKEPISNRFSITPSPSPSQYSGGVVANASPSQSMEISSHLHGIHPKRLVAPSQQQLHPHPGHIHQSSITTTASGYRSDDNNSGVLSSFDGLSTFPKRSQRIRIPSNPSVTSKSSGGKLSTSSIDKASSSVLSDRGSPMPLSFTVEYLNPPRGGGGGGGGGGGHGDPRERKPKAGDVRRIYIEKSTEQLGIQIICDEAGCRGVFVSSVTESSLAAQAGLQVGDQLLEVCGINMRSATYTLAASILQQCGESIRMLVQYSPDKFKETLQVAESSSDGDAEDEDELDDEDEDDDEEEDENASPDNSTPLSSPIEYTNKPNIVPRSSIVGNEEDIPGSAASTLTRSKAASRSASNASRTTEKTITSISNGSTEKQSTGKQSAFDPRRILLKKTTSNLGISLLGGNAVGIFIHSVHDDSPASGPTGLKPGDQIIEYNGVDLRNATAEEAAYELAKPADAVSLVAQYNMDKYMEIQDQPGDSFYIRALFDRSSIDGSLAFRKDDILFVDNTMFNGVPGLWRAWLVDQEGQKVKCGVIPSKYKVEEELMMRRSIGENGDNGGERRGSTSARRSFFRRRKHQRSNSRDSTKELASFSDVSINSCSDSGIIAGEGQEQQLVPPTYQRVERLSYTTRRPVIIVGPLMDIVFEKLEQDFPQNFQRCIPEVMRGSQQMMERCLHELKLVDYRRRGSHFECTTVAAVREICDKALHALLDVNPTSVDRLNRCHIYPIIVFLKFKSTKQIKEIKDYRYPNEKVTTKAAKEMFEHSLKLEQEFKSLINVLIPGSNLAYMCTQVHRFVDDEQNKALWVSY